MERQGLLHYAFDSYSPMRELDFKKMQAYPILIMKGYHESCHSIIDQLHGTQFIANIESESLLNKDGSPQNMDGYNREYSKKFDLIFAHGTKDCKNYYGRTAIPYHCFIDCQMFRSAKPPISRKLAFIGSTREREGFIKMCEIAVPIHVETTEKLETGEATAIKLVETMCEHPFLLSGLGKVSRYLSGRTYEIMACERVCFQYIDNECLDEFDSSILKDGYNIVFFRNGRELRDKFNYYSSRPDLCHTIAKQARSTALEHNDLDKMCHYFVNHMYNAMESKCLAA